MAGPGTAARGVGTLLLFVAAALAVAALFLPWAADDPAGGSDDKLYLPWGLQASLPNSDVGDDGPRVWFSDKLDGKVEGLDLFRITSVIVAFATVGTIVATLMALGAYKQRRRGYRWAAFASFAATFLHVVGIVLFVAAMAAHSDDRVGPTVRAHPDTFAVAYGIFVAGGAVLIGLAAAITCMVGGRTPGEGTAADEGF